MKKLLPTSIAGSLPKPSWLAQPETLWSPWKLEDEALEEGKKDALRVTLQEQKTTPHFNCRQSSKTIVACTA